MHIVIVPLIKILIKDFIGKKLYQVSLTGKSPIPVQHLFIWNN